MSNRFHQLLERVAAGVQSDYEEARQHARAKDPQRAGHEGESTWQRLIGQWGPGWPVVTRKYVVGPGGESNEVDIVILKPDYPSHLRDDASVLVSGVAAAFSSKLTLRREHIAEAIEQKKLLLDVAGRPTDSVEHVLCGPFPFGLLSHSTELFGRSEDLAADLQGLHEEIAYPKGSPLVTLPSEELDALLVADRAFLSARRASLIPDANPRLAWVPMSSLNRHSAEISHPGAPLAQFICWFNAKCFPQGAGALRALEPMFGADSASGLMTRWPISVYPEQMRTNRALLQNDYGNPLIF